MAAAKLNIMEQVTGLIAKVNEKNPYYMLGAFLLVVFLADYFLVMQFQLRVLYRLNPKVATIAGEVKVTRLDITKKAQYEAQIKVLAAKVKKVNDKIRTREQIALIIDSATRMAKKQGVLVEQIIPNAELAVPLLKDNQGQYSAIPLMIDARGSYHAFGRFVNQLEREEPFLTIADFSMESNPSDPTHHQIKITMDAVVYEMREVK